jgi:predicted nucleotidyltransferase
MTNLESLLEESFSFLQSEFNLQLQQSQLKLYSFKNWQDFCRVNSFNVNSEGLYIPISYSAYVRVDSPVLVSNIFHEYFGHGLFCEQSFIGKKLIEIIHNHNDEKSFLFNEINLKEQPFGLCKTNIGNYEGFAVWLEALLCRETNNSKIWELKKNRLPKNYISLFEFFQDAEEKLSRFGLIAQMGFPKYYNKNKITTLIKKLYSSSFKNIDFIVLYGSQKPKSDIDLFIVSTNLSQNYFNGWFDIYELNREEFNYALKHLDISVTDPLFSGKLIYGNMNQFNQLKQKILKQPITPEAIKYNFAEAEKQKDFLPYIPETDKRKKDCLSYIKSFTQNAIQLKQGNKPLTLKNLKKLL